MAQNIIVSIFEVESEAYQAMTTLFQNSYSDDSFLTQAVLVKKENGVIQELDYFDVGADTSGNTAIGGMMGAVMGILGGPLGVLLGASYGMLVGSSVDVLDSLEGASQLEQIIGKLQDGDVAIIGLANEENESVLDSKLGEFKTMTVRFDAAVVAEEVEEARLAEIELERQARETLRKVKTDEFKSKIEKRRSDLKARFKEVEQSLDKTVWY